MWYVWGKHIINPCLLSSHISCSLFTGGNFFLESAFLTGFNFQRVLFKFPIPLRYISRGLLPLQLKKNWSVIFDSMPPERGSTFPGPLSTVLESTDMCLHKRGCFKAQICPSPLSFFFFFFNNSWLSAFSLLKLKHSSYFITLIWWVREQHYLGLNQTCIYCLDTAKDCYQTMDSTFWILAFW